MAPAPQVDPPPPVNENRKAEQRAALHVKLLSQELGITPGQLRSLMLAYGSDMTNIRVAAERLRRS